MKTGSKLFLLGAVLYAATHLWAVYAIHAGRAAAWEPDDRQHYLVKAANIEGCRHQDCPALKDLHAQASFPLDDRRLTFIQERQKHRILLSYHPGLSLTLLALGKLGLPLESAAVIVEIAGTLVIGLAIALFCLTLFGPSVAGITLALMSTMLLDGQGTHSVGPYGLAAAGALLAWTALAGSGGPRYVLAGLATFLSCSLHPSGVAFAGMTFWAAVLLARPRRDRRLAVFLFSCVLCALLFTLVRFEFVDQAIGLASVFREPSLTARISSNAKVALELLKHLAVGLGPALIALALVLIFSRRQRGLGEGEGPLPEVQVRAVWIFGGLLGLAFLGSLLFWATRTPLLVRMWLAYATFAAALLSAGGWGVAAKVKGKPRLIAVGTVVAATVLINFFGLKKAVAQRNRILDISLEPGQVKTLMTEAPGGRVLYRGSELESFEAASYFYLTHGAARRGLVWSTMVMGTPQQDAWLDGNIRHLVSLNPVTEAFNGDFFLSRSGSMILRLAPGDRAGAVSLYVTNHGSPAQLRVQDGEERVIPVGRAFSGWVPIRPAGRPLSEPLLIRPKPPGGRLRLGGIKLGADQKTRWPWGSESSAELGLRGRILRLGFSKNLLMRSPACRVGEVLDDRGSTVLARLSCG